MPEPTSATVVGLTAAGLSLFGVATGLHPMLLVAGFAGGWWFNSYGEPPLPLVRRLSSGLIAALVAAWTTPPLIAWLTSLSLWPATVEPTVAGFPCALALGFLTHKVLGPALLKIAAKKVEEAT
ncbi:hypothetical protein [Dechloromonas denitrificans]|uniref:hypothetical protein n=1 Tax=Dechloromonas denitrificans TaxID=281362 RepID=UPI001CF87D65|nr:hypothetical protein [Dechloromonas denitrificans]UCV02295.1 hypothetical protein KI611_14510 [Dechloromonas denitrificans]